MSLQFGLCIPTCGGWLRVRPRPPAPDAQSLLTLGEQADRSGYDFCYLPEHYLNAVHGPAHPVLDAWVLAAGIAARTRRIRVITAVQPGFKAPGVTAKMGATIAALRPDAFGLAIIAGWWRLEAEMHGDRWLEHRERYRRAAEYLACVDGLWRRELAEIPGEHYGLRHGTASPRPHPLPLIMVAGESAPAVDLAARAADVLFINGGSVEQVRDLVERAKRHAKERYGRTIRVMLSAFALLREDDRQAQRVAEKLSAAADEDTLRYFDQQLDGAVVAHNRGAARDRIEANLGLTSGLIGGRETILRRLGSLADAGVDAIALKMEDGPEHVVRFHRDVVESFRRDARARGTD